MQNRTYNKKKLTVLLFLSFLLLLFLTGRLVYLMLVKADTYREQAERLHERERKIKAARGEIVDCNGKVLAANKTVCTVSVIHSQIRDEEKVIQMLSQELGMDKNEIEKKVQKISSMEKIKSNVDKEKGDIIRKYGLSGVKVDEDFKREYPYNDLAAKVLGFTGGDNQGIIGLEVAYEEYLKGTEGRILTLTDARGIELEGKAEDRIEPVAGHTLQISMDYQVQRYAYQAAQRVMEEKQADRVSLIVMNPQNGELLAMVDVPEFNLNDPYRLEDEETVSDDAQRQDLRNQMWRNGCINDTYEPGSAFKIMTSAACLEEGVVSLSDSFQCTGYKVVEDRRIRCWKTTGHGAETFTEGLQNSCNPVFMTIGLRLGASRFYDYFDQFGLLKKTGVDLPGEAETIMHRKKDIGEVELATMTFGQSFQITPIQMVTTVSSMINGGTRVTPHFGVRVLDASGDVLKSFSYNKKANIIKSETSATMRELLESVVSEGGASKAHIEGYAIGGKTATSQTLPRGSGKYIASFIGFAPADNPQVLAMVVIHNPQGIYYGGTIAAPVVRDLFENILPYLGIEKTVGKGYTNQCCV